MTRAFIFPGQGTQRVGMGSALVARHGAAREVFERASAVLGVDFAALCFRSGADALLATRAAQPAIFTVSCAALAVVRGWGLHPSCVAGHSVGEITALHAAGVLEFDAALRLVARRAEIMSAITADGAMVAVIGLDRDVVSDVCARVAASLGPVVVGLENAPGHVVLSGDARAVAAAAERCRALGAVRIVHLRTQLAFHSPLMTPVVAEWRAFVATLELREPSTPVVLNVTGRLASSVDDIREALVDQVASRVRWLECLRAMVDVGVTQFIEVGDSKALSFLVRSTVRDVSTVTLADPRARERLHAAPVAVVG